MPLPHDPFAPHTDSGNKTPAKEAAAPKPTDPSGSDAEQLVVTPTAAKKTAPRKRAAKTASKSTARKDGR